MSFALLFCLLTDTQIAGGSLYLIVGLKYLELDYCPCPYIISTILSTLYMFLVT